MRRHPLKYMHNVFTSLTPQKKTKKKNYKQTNKNEPLLRPKTGSGNASHPDLRYVFNTFKDSQLHNDFEVPDLIEKISTLGPNRGSYKDVGKLFVSPQFFFLDFITNRIPFTSLVTQLFRWSRTALKRYGLHLIK